MQLLVALGYFKRLKDVEEGSLKRVRLRALETATQITL